MYRIANKIVKITQKKRGGVIRPKGIRITASEFH